MRGHVAVVLMAILLAACGSGGGGGPDGALPAMLTDERVSPPQPPAPGNPPVSGTQATTSDTGSPPPVRKSTTTLPATTTKSLLPTNYGKWEDFNQGYYRVEETMWSEKSSQWVVHGTQTGSVDNLPQGSDGIKFTYTGPVWGRIYEGVRDHDTSQRPDENNGDPVYGQMDASYYTRDRYTRNDDCLNINFSRMFKVLPSGSSVSVRWMSFEGDVGTDKYDDGYDPALDVATFNLPAQQYETTFGTEQGEAVGSFYGSNGEALAATFWYQRGSHRIEGTFGGKR